MASVHLDFIPPTAPDIVKLTIFEAPSATGSFSPIEVISPVGLYPNYISEYTTNLATSATDWFAIQWEDDKGAKTDMSSPIQGGSLSLVGKLIDRVVLRDPTINENIAAQEVEAAVSAFYGVIDPYSIDPDTISPAILSGLTLLALARAYLFVSVTSSGSVQKFTAGLVSIDQGSSSSTTQRGLSDIEKIMDMGNRLLGKNYSIIAVLEELEVAGGAKQLVATDLSRSIIEVQ